MYLLKYCVFGILLIQSIQCLILDKLLEGIYKAYHPYEGLSLESWLLPNTFSDSVIKKTSTLFQNAIFHALLSQSSTCRFSLDKWDCEDCPKFLPDGKVVQAFHTNILGVQGNVIKSEARKTLYVTIRTDSNFRSKFASSQVQLVDHPTIPGAQVHQGLLVFMKDIKDIVYNAIRDQLILHPDFKVHVVAHSYGAGVGSLLVTDLYQRLPFKHKSNVAGYFLGKPRVGNKAYAKYIADNHISITRYVNKADSVVHQPSLIKGYMHEGDEYWYSNINVLVHCPGPFETSECSNSVLFTKYDDHKNYFGASQYCENDLVDFF